MKVIELLNKIANGEEVPKYVTYYNMLKEKVDIMYVCKENLFYKLDQLEIQINSRVEIIEEKEMCHKCHKYPAEYNQTYCEFCLGISKLEEHKIPEKFKVHSLGDKDEYGHYVKSPFPTEEEMMNKINEILDYLEEIE